MSYTIIEPDLVSEVIISWVSLRLVMVNDAAASVFTFSTSSPPDSPSSSYSQLIPKFYRYLQGINPEVLPLFARNSEDLPPLLFYNLSIEPLSLNSLLLPTSNHHQPTCAHSSPSNHKRRRGSKWQTSPPKISTRPESCLRWPEASVQSPAKSGLHSHLWFLRGDLSQNGFKRLEHPGHISPPDI